MTEAEFIVLVKARGIPTWVSMMQERKALQAQGKTPAEIVALLSPKYGD